MSMNVLDKLRGERDELIQSAEALINTDEFDPTDKNYVEMRSGAEAIDQKIKAIVEFQAARSAADQIDALSTRQVRKSKEQTQTTESPGDLFVRSSAYKDYRYKGSSSAIDVEFRAVHTVTGVGGFAGVPQRFDFSEPRPGTPLSSLVTTVPVTGNSIEYVKYVFDSNAAIVPEGTPKPESTLTRTIVPKALDTVAHFSEITRQLAEDEQAVVSIINDELRWGVNVKFEELIGDAILGATLPTATGDDLLQAIRIAIGQLPDGYYANGLLLNPADWALLDIGVMVAAGTSPTGTAEFWGLAPVSSTQVPVGTAIVGDFRQSVRFWRRSNASVFITDSHADRFLSNIFTLLAEGRGAADVVRPTGLVKATGTVLPLAAGAGGGGAKK